MADKRATTGKGSAGDPDIPALRWRLTGAVLLWEAALPLAWPILSLLLLFLAVAQFDLLPRLPGWLHAGLLLAFAAALVFFLRRLRRLRRPEAAAVRRRLETDSGLAHRPLSLLTDRLVAGTDDPLARALWEVERHNARHRLKQLRLRPPRPLLAAADPWGLRFVPVLLLTIALAGPAADPSQRLGRALNPSLGLWDGPPVVLQVWVTPPDYTGLAPWLLDNSAPAPLRVPAGSTLLAELQDGHGQAELLIDGAAQPFQPLGADSQRLETVLRTGHRLVVRRGFHRLATWDLEVVADQPPVIALTSPPRADPDGRTHLDYRAQDDYGIVKAWLLIRRADSPGDEPAVVPLPLSGNRSGALLQSAQLDLTGSPWAGLPVTLQPAAEDGAKQTGLGKAEPFTLPERSFATPVARAIIAQRRHLADDPLRRQDVAAALADIADDTESYQGDLLVSLTLSAAIARLQVNPEPDAVPGVLDILWQTALRVEEGDRPQAERALAEASRELREALAADAPQAERDRLIAQLQAAIGQYLNALAAEAARQGQAPPLDPDARVLSPDDLKAMIEQMRDLSNTGSAEAAQQMLSHLQQMLEGLRSGIGGDSEQTRQARQAMAALQALTRDQSALLDQTFRRNQARQAEQPPVGAEEEGGEMAMPPPVRGKAAERERQAATASQQTLRQRLGDLMQSLGDLGSDIPQGLGQAEQAMRSATAALKADRLDDAVTAQSEALNHLQEGRRQALQALARQQGGGFSVLPDGSGSGRDPLGRAMDRGDVKIPERADLQKAREVLDELRRRSGEGSRPAAERDYLQRLLRQLF